MVIKGTPFGVPFCADGENVIGENGKSAINFGKRFAIFVYTCYTVWAL